METHRRKADGRRVFTPQFKQEQVARLGRQELTVAELARELAVETPSAGAPAAIVAVGGHRAKVLWTKSLAELRALALSRPPSNPTPKQRRTNVYERSETVRVYALKRANGTCEGCGLPGPFLDLDGRPYLEAPHIRRVADGGPDHPAWVIGICPTCHARVHNGKDGKVFNAMLASVVQQIEAAG